MRTLNLDALLAGDAQFETPEFALVAAATRWPRTPEAQARVRAEADRVSDWPRVVQIIDRHRVSGLASGMLAGLADPDAYAEIAASARENAVQELMFVHETLRLVRLIEVEDISVSVLKGVSAALMAFGRFGVRHSTDIDLMVPPACVASAASVLDAQGYVRIEPAKNADESAMRARMARYKDFVFEHPITGTVVELHWRLFQNRYLLRGKDLDRRTTIELHPGARVSALQRDVAVLYLFAHGTEHGWARLKWLADIGAILSAEGVHGAERIYFTARKRGAGQLVAPGMVLSHALYGTALPDAVRRDVARDWRTRSLIRTAYDSLVGEEDGHELEDRAHATTRKNLSHYLMSKDIRFVFSEIRYDLLDRTEDRPAYTSRIARLATRLWRLASRDRRRVHGKELDAAAIRSDGG